MPSIPDMRMLCCPWWDFLSILAGMIDTSDLEPSEKAVCFLCVVLVSQSTTNIYDRTKPSKEEKEITLANLLIPQVTLGSTYLSKGWSPVCFSWHRLLVQVWVQVYAPMSSTGRQFVGDCAKGLFAKSHLRHVRLTRRWNGQGTEAPIWKNRTGDSSRFRVESFSAKDEFHRFLFLLKMFK